MYLKIAEPQNAPKSSSFLKKNGVFRLWAYDGQLIQRSEDYFFKAVIPREGERYVLAGDQDFTHVECLGAKSATLEDYFLQKDVEYAYLISDLNIDEFEACVQRLIRHGKNNVHVFFQEQDSIAKSLQLIFKVHEKYKDFQMRFSYDHGVLLGLVYGRPMTPPRRAVIEIHESCNLKCDFCWTHSPFLKKKEEENLEKPRRKIALDENLFYEYVDELATIPADIVELCAIGDPLYHPKIWEMIHYTKKKGLRVRISTNATLINKKNAEDIIRIGVDEIFINVSGGDPRSYADIHNVSESLFEHLKKTLCYLNEMKKKSLGCPLRMEHVNVITEKNATTILNMLDFARLTGADLVSFRMAWEHRDILTELHLKDATLVRLLSEIKGYIKVAEEFGLKHNFESWEIELRAVARERGILKYENPMGFPDNIMPLLAPQFENIPTVVGENNQVDLQKLDVFWMDKALAKKPPSTVIDNTANIVGESAKEHHPICAVGYHFTLIGSDDQLRYCCHGDRVIEKYDTLKKQWLDDKYQNLRENWKQAFRDNKSLCVGCPHVEENYRYAKLLKQHGLTYKV
jgi:molybdenum cofactor biosynthesis enzyme MoaA